MIAGGSRALGAWLLGVALLMAEPAPASDAEPRAPEPQATVLEWRAPDGCPDARAVYESLSAVLGRAPVALGEFSEVSGTIEPRDGRFVLTIEMVEHGRRSSRLISAPRCEDMAEAAAIAIGLALTSEREPDTVAQAAGAPPPVTLPSELDAPAPPVHERAYRLALSADALLDLNSLPSAAPGLRVQGRVQIGLASLALYGAFLPGSELAVGAREQVEFSLLAGGARVCYLPPGGALSLAACAGGEVGRYSADGGELNDARRVHNLWLAPSAGLELGVAFSRSFGAELGADVFVPLVRSRYAVNDTELVFRPPEAAIRLYLGLCWGAE
jgi:hypothetical protein